VDQQRRINNSPVLGSVNSSALTRLPSGRTIGYLTPMCPIGQGKICRYQMIPRGNVSNWT
jgi:hypothetical protein